ncbi:uncharacterized protein [Branchiostoma lanceolatum]|uniref:uncharacterized protein n=1 Tax=Branchiostoma lanceolatum TaxID=7740 RepID=UPI003454F470
MITIVPGSVGFQLGFGVSFLLITGIVKLFGQRKNDGIYISIIHTIVDWYVRRNGFLNIFFLFGNEQSVGYPCLQYLMFAMATVIISFVLVIPWPMGVKPGIAMAFCLMCPPTQLLYDDIPSHLYQWFTHWNIDGPTCLFAAAGLLGVMSYNRYLALTLVVLLPVFCGIANVVIDVSQHIDYILSFIGGFAFGATDTACYHIIEKLCNSQIRGLQLKIFMGPIGFVYGIAMGQWFFGWRMVLPSTWKDSYYMVPNMVAMLILVHKERQRVYWANQETGSYPAVLVGRTIKSLKQVKDLPLRFTLIDFAGDTVYHCTHHLFLSNLSIHLIVFNMERLEQEPDYIRRICSWVQSVIVHVQNPNPHIFIVGTHTNSLPIERRKFLSSKVSKALLSNENFAQLIVGKPDNNKDILFSVENSLPLRQDPQARLLRKTIMEVTASSFQSKRHFPIKWLKVSDFVNKYKCSSKATCLLDKRTLFDKLRQEGVVEAKDEGEDFEQMLKFYDEIGELKVMGDVVVLDLTALVQLVVELVELDCDDHELGIVHVSSLRRVWKFLTAENFLSAIALFERYDILCPIDQEQYLVPLLLETNEEIMPKKGTEQEKTDHGGSAFWDTAESDTVLYFKFYKFHPEAIFLRLLARCLSISQKTHDLGRGADRDVYRNVGRFYQGHDFYYNVEIVCPSVEQNMIQVTVKCAPNRGPHSLLSRLHKDLQQIRDRDFPYLNYTVGLPCPACRSLNKRKGEKDRPPPHILRVAGHDEELPRPGEKTTLMCRGNAFKVDLGENQSSWDVALSTSAEESSKTSEQKSGSGLVDPKTLQHLSILLDPPAPIFGNNWKALADELGLCFQDICYIESKHNPTEMVLEMYHKNTPTANSDQIHRALLDIDRVDAAELLLPTSVESQETT